MLSKAPRPLLQSWSSPSPATIAHYNGTLQWHHVHSTIAHYNGTLQWHPAMAPSNGTTSTAPWNAILVPRPMRKSGSSPPPPIGSKNPYSYHYLGKNTRGIKRRPICRAITRNQSDAMSMSMSTKAHHTTPRQRSVKVPGKYHNMTLQLMDWEKLPLSYQLLETFCEEPLLFDRNPTRKKTNAKYIAHRIWCWTCWKTSP